MNNRFETIFEDVLAVNQRGEVRNLLISDYNARFLDDAFAALRRWTGDKGFHLFELDERDGSWLPQIESRELFRRLNWPNTVLVIRNHGTVSPKLDGDNRIRRFLYQAIVNRHYGSDGNFDPSDELDGLLFTVVLNPLAEMNWREDEYSLFTVLREDDRKGAWVNKSVCRRDSRLYPVLTVVNKVHYYVSGDETTVCVDVSNGFCRGGSSPGRPIRRYTAEDRTGIIHDYLERDLYCACDKVECLILRMDRFTKEERFVVDAARLAETFPRLQRIYHAEQLEIVNAGKDLQILTPFELGEYAFRAAQTGDFKTANELTRKLWALDHKWAKFYREVAVDYQVPREQHERCYPDGNVKNTGLDKLFRIYLLGWYTPTGEFDYREQRVYVEKHQNIDKAIELLNVRFKNWDHDEIIEKLYFDLDHVELRKEWYENKLEERDQYTEEDFEEEVERWKPDYSGFMGALIATDRLYPGTIDKFYDDGVISRILNK